MKIAIVTPVGNEINNIGPFYDQITQILDQDSIWIPVFDNYCTDGTYEWLINKKHPSVKDIHIGKKQGLAKVYISGNKEAITIGAEKIIEVDIGHPVDLIPTIAKTLDLAPLVMGTRYGKGSMNQPFHRKLVSLGGTLLSKIVLGLPFSDCTSGLQGFTIDVAKKIDWDGFLSHGHFYQTEFKYYCKNIPYVEIPFDYSGGESSLKIKEVMKSIALLFELRKREAIRI